MRDYKQYLNVGDGHAEGALNIVNLGLNLHKKNANIPQPKEVTRIFDHKKQANGRLYYFYPSPKTIEIDFGGKKYAADFQFTKDPSLLERYYKLRDFQYKNDAGWTTYNGSENEFDINNHILVVTINGKLIGGARLSFSAQGKLMSNECAKSGFLFKNIAAGHDIQLKDGLYGEISALVIDSPYRGRVVLNNIFDLIVQYSRQFGIEYLFGVAVYRSNRSYKLHFNKIGVESFIDEKYIAPEKSLYNYNKMSSLIIKI